VIEALRDMLIGENFNCAPISKHNLPNMALKWLEYFWVQPSEGDAMFVRVSCDENTVHLYRFGSIDTIKLELCDPLCFELLIGHLHRLGLRSGDTIISPEN